jgi:hypothetical protein
MAAARIHQGLFEHRRIVITAPRRFGRNYFSWMLHYIGAEVERMGFHVEIFRTERHFGLYRSLTFDND